MTDFRFGLGIGDFPEDGSSGTEFMSKTINYLKETGQQYDSIWIPDHLSHFINGKRVDVFESMTTISHISALFTKHIFGTCVLCNSFRNPALTAKMSATLDALTGGRFILGIGGGWHKLEYEQYGYEYPPNMVRIRQLEEAARIIKGLWKQDDFSFNGQYYSVKNVSCYPKPKNPRLMIGGSGEALTLKVVAKHADLWNAALISPGAYKRKVGVLRRHCVRVGRNFDEVGRTLLCFISLADSDAEAKRLASVTDFRDYPLVVGSPRSVVKHLGEYVDAGVEGFITVFVPFPDARASLLFAEEVMPELGISP